jgi:hypothetical protein
VTRFAAAKANTGKPRIRAHTVAMSLADLFKIPLVIGLVITMVSMGRSYWPELSRRFTAWGWVLVGIGLPGNLLFLRSGSSGALREFEWILRGGGILIGIVFLVFGLRRLRTEPPFEPEVRGSRNWWGWVLTFIGIAAALFVLLSPAARDQTVNEDTPRFLLALLIVIFVGVRLGRVLLGKATRTNR